MAFIMADILSDLQPRNLAFPALFLPTNIELASFCSIL